LEHNCEPWDVKAASCGAKHKPKRVQLTNGNKVMCMTNHVTVSKLSKLQKQILIYARQQMLTKQQEIKAATGVTLCMRAPSWLDKALSEAMRAITKARRGYMLGRKDGVQFFLTALHPWMRPFAEMTFLRSQIEKAAKEAGVESKIDLTALYQLPFDKLESKFWGLAGRLYHPWPYIDDNGWHFKMTIEGASIDKVQPLIEGLSGVWAYDDAGGPANCTIPELLRDLFGFPVQGHIDALAFSIEEIGAQRYNTAQASLRRACTRLQTRGLISIWYGQRQTLSIFQLDVYTRSRIGLTETGVAVADGLLKKADKPTIATAALCL
jgi:hypothetical protein